MHVAHAEAFVPKPITSFRNEKKDYDANSIAKTLGLKPSQVARVLGVSPSTISRNAASPRIRGRAARLEQLLNVLTELYDDRDYAIAWLKTPSPLWDPQGERSALDLIGQEEWGMEHVESVVQRMRRGEPFT